MTIASANHDTLPALPANEIDADFLTQMIETQADVAALSLDINIIMKMVAERAQHLTRAAGACVQIADGDEMVFRCAVGAVAPFVNTRISLSASLAGHAFRTQQHVYCRDSQSDPHADRALSSRMNMRSLIAVPLVLGARSMGVMLVCSREVDAFNPRDIASLRLMAGVVTAALSHAEEFEAKQKLLVDRTAMLSAIQESDERFRSAFAHAAIGMALVGLDGRWLQVNHSLCQIVGYSPEQLLATDFQSITHPEDLDADMAFVRQLIAGSIPHYQMVKRYFHAQGHVVWVLLSVSLVHSATGRPLYFISQIQDITRRQHVEASLRASEEEYRATFELASVGKAQTDLATGKFLRVNRKLCQITGYTEAELLVRTMYDVTHPDDLAVSREAADGLNPTQRPELCFEKRYIRKDGGTIWVEVNAGLIREANGTYTRAVATIHDITSRKRAEWLERDRRRVLEMVARDLPLPDVLKQLSEAVERQLIGTATVVMVLEDGGVRLHGGPNLPAGWTALLQAQSLSLAARLASDAWQDETGCGCSDPMHDDAWEPLQSEANLQGYSSCWAVPISASDGSSHGIVGVFGRDARRPTPTELQTLDLAGKLATICVEHHLTTRRLGYMVRHDNLTGLPNRLMFDDRLHQAISIARRSGKSVALLALDIDKFKSVNDTLGHDAGDELLQQFAHRLSGVLRETDTMARMGGDEFLIVLPELDDAAGAQTVAQKLLDTLVEPFTPRMQTLRATSSIGVAIFPQHATDAIALQKKADLALYQAKEAGRNGYAICMG